MWHLSIKIRERERFLYCLVAFWENASITRHSFIQLSLVSPILITYHIPWIEIKSTWFMMTSRNKNFIEVIYWTFIDLGWKTYYHFHKCRYSKCRNETKTFIVNIESNTCWIRFSYSHHLSICKTFIGSKCWPKSIKM